MLSSLTPALLVFVLGHFCCGTLGFQKGRLNNRPPSAPFNSTWFSSRTDMNVTVSGYDNAHRAKASRQRANGGGMLTWSPIAKPDVILTYLPEARMLETDKPVKLTFRWLSSGTNDCPPSDWKDHGYCKDDEPCMHTSVNCLAGTGDFRIFVGDSKTGGSGRVQADGFANTTSYGDMDKFLKGAPFNDYRGYDFRLFPHISDKADRYVPKVSGSTAVPCSINRKDDDQLFGKNRIAYFGCFEAPLDEWTELVLEIEKKSDRYDISMDMNGIKRAVTDRSMPHDLTPKLIDTVAIQYPNGRHYTHVKFDYPQ